MRTPVIIFLLLLPLSGFAQSLGGYSDAANLGDFLRDANTEMRKMTGEAYGTIGTPYVFEEFQNGTVYFNNKTAARTITINYDCFNDRVLLNRGDVDYILDKRMIDYLEFSAYGDSSVVFKQVFIKEKKSTIFLELLYKQESTLYKHHYKSFMEADYTGPYSQDKRYNEYIDNYEWYIELGGKEPVRLRPARKAILQLMEEHGKEIDKFLKQEKPDLKSDDGLVRLVRYYDELAKGK